MEKEIVSTKVKRKGKKEKRKNQKRRNRKGRKEGRRKRNVKSGKWFLKETKKK